MCWVARNGSAGVLCLVKGNGAGGWIPNPDPGCRDGSPIGWEWDVFDIIFRPGDFNHDGKEDVLARWAGAPGRLCMIAGDGAGGWIPNPDPPCGDGTEIGNGWDIFNSIIGPGDFNGDGFNDVIARKTSNRELCLFNGNGYGGWIVNPDPACGDGTSIGTGWSTYNFLAAPSDWAGNGDSCPDVVARQSASPYWLKYHSGNCGVNGQYFKEQSGVNIESAWSSFNWLLSVGDFSGDICSDVLTRAGGFLYQRRGNCNGGLTGGFTTIGSEWNLFNWIG